MNKIIPFIFVITFWGLFYLGTKDSQIGKTIAFVAVAVAIMLLLYSLKNYLFRKINNYK